MLRREEGNAAVELVILAPVLLLLVAVIVGAGRIVTTKSALESVAREAARTGSQAVDAAEAHALTESQARAVADGLELEASRMKVSIDVGTFARGTPLVVAVDYEVRLQDLPAFGLIPGGFTVSARHVELIERYKSR